MQVLNFVGGRNDAPEYLEKMFMVYGAVYPYHFSLGFKRVVALKN